MTFNTKRFQEIIFFTALFALIPLWNIPHTIAGRYTCEAILLISVVLYKPEWRLFFKSNKALIVFFAYLIFQLIFFSENYQIAFNNFRAEWMHFILFSIIGAGTGLILGKKNLQQFLLYLGIAFSIPLYIHLTLSLFKGISIGAIPWGYWGISEIHGDFGYPALEAGILLTTLYLCQGRTKFLGLFVGGLLVICIASPLLAASRGGVLFTLVGMLITSASYFYSVETKKYHPKIIILTLLAILVIVGGIYNIGVSYDPARWSGIASRLMTGFEGEPNKVYCDGIDTLRHELENQGVKITPSIQKQLDSVVDGDGARMMAARSGLQLIAKHPMGIDQSKKAYQIAITEFCGTNPKIFISHTHDAWIDTSLAIGIPGALLLLLVLIRYAQIGYHHLKENLPSSPYGLALFSSASVWILRGFLDSTMRDQMLEMQAFIFALLLGLIISKSTQDTKQH